MTPQQAGQRRWIAAILVVVGIPVVWLTFGRLHPPSDEAQIRGLVARGAEGVETRNLRKALSIISERYKDEEGNNRPDLVRLAAGAFQSTRSIAIQTSNLEVQVNRRKAISTCMVTVLFADTSGSQETLASNVELRWEKEGRKWKVVRMKGLVYPDSE